MKTKSFIKPKKETNKEKLLKKVTDRILLYDTIVNDTYYNTDLVTVEYRKKANNLREIRRLIINLPAIFFVPRRFPLPVVTSIRLSLESHEITL